MKLHLTSKRLRRMISTLLALALCFSALLPMTAINADAVEVSPGTKTIDYLYSIKNNGITVNNITSSSFISGYTSASLSKKSGKGIAAQKTVTLTLIDVNRSYKSVKLKFSNGNSYWFPASVIVGSSSTVSTYQLTRNLTVYKTASTALTAATVNVSSLSQKIGTTKADIAVLGTTTSYVRVLAGSRIGYVKKTDLYTCPLSANTEYNITSGVLPKSNNFIDDANNFTTSWNLAPSSKSAGSYLKLDKLGALSNPLAKKYKFTFVYNSTTGYYKIKSSYSGLYLAAKKSGAATAGTQLQFVKDSCDSQNFQIIPCGNYYYIRSIYGTYIDLPNGSLTDGVKVQFYTGNQSNAQKWSIMKVLL